MKEERCNNKIPYRFVLSRDLARGLVLACGVRLLSCLFEYLWVGGGWVRAGLTSTVQCTMYQVPLYINYSVVGRESAGLPTPQPGRPYGYRERTGRGDMQGTWGRRGMPLAG